MKTIEIYRYDLTHPLVLANGDTYDSRIRVLDDAGTVLRNVDFVNTDATVNYCGGRLSYGDYYAIRGPHGKTGYPALWIFKSQNPASVHELVDVTAEMLTLPSEIPNPNHGGERIITEVHIHKGGLTWDYSHGCITIATDDLLRDNWTPFIALFPEGEVIRVRLICGRSAC